SVKLLKGKEIILSSMSISTKPRFPKLGACFRSNPQYLLTLNRSLENLFIRVNEERGKEILDCIQVINNKLEN
ncbi:MAG: hypothetical protein ACFFAG_18475, partial [Promethearchaeota archaeon]